LAPTQVIEVTPEPCACGQREFSVTTPDDTPQVIELREMAIQIEQLILYEARCHRCGHLLKAEVPAENRLRHPDSGYG
jgi:hypothetical protein